MPKSKNAVRAQLELSAAETKQKYLFAKGALDEYNRPKRKKPGVSVFEVLVVAAIIFGGWKMYAYYTQNTAPTPSTQTIKSPEGPSETTTTPQG